MNTVEQYVEMKRMAVNSLQRDINFLKRQLSVLDLVDSDCFVFEDEKNGKIEIETRDYSLANRVEIEKSWNQGGDIFLVTGTDANMNII